MLREWLDGHSVRAGVLHQLDFGLGDLRSFLLLDDAALDLDKTVSQSTKYAAAKARENIP